ncbi:protein disulfide-isomerase A6 homolog [Gigantopelta aegis]|uniref:protein disulfide-isomerase A6 homolog n=1 Tax=Gigantopelta aegis TaxID=1735272 RepID=UPI001B88B7C6|nr:protein disulfide-isomerase A6 homolog [Gigantopelta aegis]
MIVFLLCLAVGLGTTSASYDASDDVIELTPANFNKKVMDSDAVWFVEFYAPWCGHCKALEPEWKKAATILKGIVRVAAVNADEHKSLGGQFGVQGFPTIKIFSKNKKAPKDYQGPRTSQGIVDGAMNEIKSVVQDRSGGKKSGGGGGGGGGKAGDPKDVVELTDSNFEELVLKSDDLWLVEFYAPWCGHCKNLAPHWAQAASELKGKVKVGALDATVHTVMSSRYGVQGFPTIKMFAAGKKDDGAVDYDGGRTASDIISWAKDKLAENVPPPDVYELVSEKKLTECCEGHQLCIVSVLPHILDCQSKCRNNYISMLKRLGEKFKKNMWGWVWAEGAAQPHVEEALGIGGFGYPALAAMNSRKMKYSWLKQAFDEKGITEFLREVQYGRGSTAPIKDGKLPEVKTIDPWDGKDGQLPEEEDIDLSDVDLDDIGKEEL